MTARPAPPTPLEVAVHDLREIIALRESPDLIGLSPEEIYEQQSVAHHGRVTTSGLRVVLDTLESTRAQLAAVTLERDMIATMPPVRTTPNGFACWCENFDGTGHYSYCHAMRKAHFALPALSPTQPTPTKETTREA